MRHYALKQAQLPNSFAPSQQFDFYLERMDERVAALAEYINTFIPSIKIINKYYYTDSFAATYYNEDYLNNIVRTDSVGHFRYIDVSNLKYNEALINSYASEINVQYGENQHNPPTADPIPFYVLPEGFLILKKNRIENNDISLATNPANYLVYAISSAGTNYMPINMIDGKWIFEYTPKSTDIYGKQVLMNILPRNSRYKYVTRDNDDHLFYEMLWDKDIHIEMLYTCANFNGIQPTYPMITNNDNTLWVFSKSIVHERIRYSDSNDISYIEFPDETSKIGTTKIDKISVSYYNIIVKDTVLDNTYIHLF